MPTCNSDKHAGQTVVWADGRKKCAACVAIDKLATVEPKAIRQVYPDKIMALFDDLIETIKQDRKPEKKTVPAQVGVSIGFHPAEQAIANGQDDPDRP